MVLSTSRQILQAFFCRTETFVLFQRASDIWQIPKKTSPLKIHFLSGFCFLFFSLEVCFPLSSVCKAIGKKYCGYFSVLIPPIASLIMAPGDSNSQLNSLRLGRGGLGEERQYLGRKEDESKQPGLNLGLGLGRHSPNRSTKWTKFYTLTSHPPPSEPNIRLS